MNLSCCVHSTGYFESQILSSVAWALFGPHKTESFDADLLQRSCTENMSNWSHATNALSRTLRRPVVDENGAN